VGIYFYHPIILFFGLFHITILYKTTLGFYCQPELVEGDLHQNALPGFDKLSLTFS